jgi:dTMP kinase
MFITIDGPDGTGKTSLARLVAYKLSLRRDTVYTAEPTDSPLGRRIREILKIGTKEEQLMLTDLFVQDRESHINDYIKPELEKGKIIICDRYKYSTVCYQQLQGVDASHLIELNKGFLRPDYAFILSVDDVDVLINRIIDRNKEKDFFETKALMQQSIEIYNKMQLYFPDDNIIFIDAKSPLEELAGIIIAITSYEPSDDEW